MPIKYKIDVLAELKAKGYSTTRIRKEKIIGEATMQRLRHKQSVSFDVLSKLCNLLECDIGDILSNEDEQAD
ncbi:MAG: helix-turn-helix transcriptional regulator [Ruminococcus sp.]|nr:helix-turn-helix transcriptional regulator [Ruminococcus sp.]